MYCPKCKKDIKPGSEKRGFHPFGAATGAAGSILFVWSVLGEDPYDIMLWIGFIFIIIGLILGFAIRRTVCPACDKRLLPENPFDDS